MILHIVSKSPFESTALNRCLNLMTKDDGLLLIEDGVLLLSNPTVIAELNTVAKQKLYLLETDLTTRNLKVPADYPGRLIDYGGFVDLICQYEKSLSWF